MSRIKTTVVFPDGQHKDFYFGVTPSIGNKITLGKYVDDDVDEDGYPRQKFVEKAYRVKDIHFALGEHVGIGYHEDTTLVITLDDLDPRQIYIEPAVY